MAGNRKSYDRSARVPGGRRLPGRVGMIAARRPVKSRDLSGSALPEPAVPPFAVRFSEAVIGEFTAGCEQIARSGTLTLGPRTARFEALVAGLAGTTEAVAVTSGTTALELAFEGLGLKNDPVLVPTNTSPATAAAALRCTTAVMTGTPADGDRARGAGRSSWQPADAAVEAQRDLGLARLRVPAADVSHARGDQVEPGEELGDLSAGAGNGRR